MLIKQDRCVKIRFLYSKAESIFWEKLKYPFRHLLCITLCLLSSPLFVLNAMGMTRSLINFTQAQPISVSIPTPLPQPGRPRIG